MFSASSLQDQQLLICMNPNVRTMLIYLCTFKYDLFGWLYVLTWHDLGTKGVWKGVAAWIIYCYPNVGKGSNECSSMEP
jgi:hypothetical protein